MSAQASKLKLLHVIPGFGIGGAESLVKNLLISHNRERFLPKACSLYPRKDTHLERELDENGVDILYLGKTLGPDIATVLDLYRVIRGFKPDIIHTHLHALYYALPSFIACRIPLLVHTVHSIPEKEARPLGRWINRYAFRSRRIQPVGLSKEVSASIERLYNINNVPYIFNGVPTGRYLRDDGCRREMRASMDIPEDGFVIAHIASFSPWKNHRLLVDSFSVVCDEHPSAVLLLAGDGPLRPEIEKAVRLKGLQGNVRFLGIRSDVADILAACDLCVLSSDREGVPISILEAMSAGRPVVATAVGGIRELISDGENGFLTKPGDKSSLAAAILKLSNPAVAREMGLASRRIAVERFDIKSVAMQYEELYLGMLGKQAAGHA